MTDTSAPQPIRGTHGADDPGPRNIALDKMNPNILLPPATDNGGMPNLKFPFAMAHNRLEDGGWAREVTVRECPSFKELAIVNMRLRMPSRGWKRAPSSCSSSTMAIFRKTKHFW